jgi:hypothetical protein
MSTEQDSGLGSALGRKAGCIRRDWCLPACLTLLAFGQFALAKHPELILADSEREKQTATVVEP